MSELILALDVDNTKEAERLINLALPVSSDRIIFKVGYQLFFSAGPEFLVKLSSQGIRLFLDLKLHDIPNTVKNGVDQIERLGVEMFTVHLSGGAAMIAQAHEALLSVEKKPKMLGVTVLTSFDDPRWQDLGFTSSVEKSVEHLCNQGISWGVDGIVCSPKELRNIRKNHPETYVVVPGIRSKSFSVSNPGSGLASNTALNSNDDQARTMSPREAFKEGASAIVVGRPFYQSPDPVNIVKCILKEIS
jgi:orotidine-5'-phosphate decarboxylase